MSDKPKPPLPPIVIRLDDEPEPPSSSPPPPPPTSTPADFSAPPQAEEKVKVKANLSPTNDGAPLLITDTIEIVPNSGHHYFFFPIERKEFDRLGQPGKDLLRMCIEDRQPWERMPEAQWIACRLGLWAPRKSDSECGVWLCVESNLGTHGRGSILVPYEEITPIPYDGQRPPSPYAYESERRIPEEQTLETFKLTNGEVGLHVADVRVAWAPERAAAPIDVDLVVDFGNTRTTAVLLEDLPSDVSAGANSPPLSAMVAPVKFMPRGREYSPKPDEGRTIIDSWFVTHEPLFSNFEPPILSEHEACEELQIEDRVAKGAKFFSDAEEKTYVVGRTLRVPHVFVENAPIVIGDDAKEALAQADFTKGGRCFLSSPKRYAWDVTQNEKGLFWVMIPNRWSAPAATAANPKLQANVLRFMPVNGLDWHPTSPPWEWEPAHRPRSNPEQPLYPNADALSWMALAVIETAYRQMNSHAFWKDNFPYVTRRLRSLQVTFPSGWTTPELQAYEAKWRKAVNIFAATHLEHLHDAPELDLSLDEAVASQLPIIFSEMEHMRTIGDNWLSLIGRIREGDDDYKARVMTIDVGGGTSDYSIVEYEDRRRGPGIDLHATLLFKDSVTIAGDAIVRSLIERVLLPKLGERYDDDTDLRRRFDLLFQDALPSQVQRERWKRITRLVLIPKVTKWLEDLAANRPISPDNEFLLSEQSVIDELNREGEDCGLGPIFKPEEPMDVGEEEIKECIAEVLRDTFFGLGKFVSAFDVDLVILCGKPTEVPQVSELLEQSLPISRQRIISTKNYVVGSWYPFAKEGKIVDAKTVTVTGVALHQAITKRKVPGWSITYNPLDQRYKNYWEIINGDDSFTEILSPQEDDTTVEVMIGDRIGRRLLPVAGADPIYLVQWLTNSPERQPPPQIGLTLRRQPPLQGNETEGLELVGVHGVASDGSPITTSDVQLKLCTLEGSEYWIDKARFTVLRPEEDWD